MNGSCTSFGFWKIILQLFSEKKEKKFLLSCKKIKGRESDDRFGELLHISRTHNVQQITREARWLSQEKNHLLHAAQSFILKYVLVEEFPSYLVYTRSTYFGPFS